MDSSSTQGSESDFAAVLQSFYGLAGDLDAWPKALQEILGFVGGAFGCIGVADRRPAALVSVFAGQPAPGHWLEWRPGPDLFTTLNGLLGRAHRTAIHALPFGPGQLLAASFANDGPRSVIVAVLRDDPFSTWDIDRLNTLLPHLRNLFRIHVKIVGLSVRMSDLRGVLEMFDSAILLVRRTGDVFLANDAARHLLAQGDGLRLSGDRLQAPGRRDTALLAAAIDQVGCRAGDTTLRSLLLNRTVEGGQYMVHIIRLPPPLEPTGITGADVAVVVTAPTAPCQPPAAVLRAMGLTPAEARLALALSGSERLDEIASHQGVTKGTLRSQLLGIFRKTGTCRQADLITFLHSLASVSLRFTEQSASPPGPAR